MIQIVHILWLPVNDCRLLHETHLLYDTVQRGNIIPVQFLMGFLVFFLMPFPLWIDHPYIVVDSHQNAAAYAVCFILISHGCSLKTWCEVFYFVGKVLGIQDHKPKSYNTISSLSGTQDNSSISPWKLLLVIITLH